MNIYIVTQCNDLGDYYINSNICAFTDKNKAQEFINDYNSTLHSYETYFKANSKIDFETFSNITEEIYCIKFDPDNIDKYDNDVIIILNKYNISKEDYERCGDLKYEYDCLCRFDIEELELKD